MAKRTELQVHLSFDREACVWFVAKSEVPGLSLEAATAEELLRRIVECAPELIELNWGERAEVKGLKRAEHKPAARRSVRPGQKPAFSVRPVFDAPLDLACA